MPHVHVPVHGLDPPLKWSSIEEMRSKHIWMALVPLVMENGDGLIPPAGHDAFSMSRSEDHTNEAYGQFVTFDMYMGNIISIQQ